MNEQSTPFSSQHHSFDIRLAKIHSIEEAIIIHHFQHWIGLNARAGRNFHDGKTWSYQTYKSIAEHFPYWTYEQIKYICEKLVIKKILLKSNYNKKGFDKTSWYAFVDEKMFGIEQNSKISYERENSPSIGKFPSPIPDTKPSDSKAIKEQHTKPAVDKSRQPLNVVLSYEKEKREALARFCLSQRKLKEFLTFELNQIRDAIAAFDQSFAIEQIDNPVGWLTNAIRGAWKPNLSQEEVKKIKDNLTHQQERTRSRIYSLLKNYIESNEHKLRQDVKIKLTNYMVFLDMPHGRTGIELWNEDAILMVEYFIEQNNKNP